MPGVSVQNLDPDGNPVPDGEVGELFLKGPNLFSGYWRRADATAASHRDGWFRSVCDDHELQQEDARQNEGQLEFHGGPLLG